MPKRRDDPLFSLDIAGLFPVTISITAATKKFKLIPNGLKPGQYFCNACGRFFGKEAAQGLADVGRALNESDLADMLTRHGGFTVRVKKGLKLGARDSRYI